MPPASRSTSIATSRSSSRQPDNLDVGRAAGDREPRDRRPHVEAARPGGAGIHPDAAAFAGDDRAVRVAEDHDVARVTREGERRRDRKSTRLNSSHRCISYAVFCLKKKNEKKQKK